MTASAGAPTRVAYLHHRAQISGGEHSLLNLWTHLDRGRFRPVLLGAESGDFVNAARALDVECIPATFPRLGSYVGPAGWRQIERLDRQLAGLGATIVHGNTTHSNVAGALSGRRSRRRIVWHGRTLPRPGEPDVERLLRWLPDSIICNSEAVAGRFGGIGDRVEVVLNGVPLDRFHPQVEGAGVRRELGIEPHEVAVGIVGNFGPVKKHELFLDAAAIVTRQFPETRFVIVGDEVFPENRGRGTHIRNRAAAAGVADSTVFAGVRDDMPAVFAALDIVVSTASEEACSRAIVESLASGTPVVAADAGGNPELVADDETGVLFTPDDAAALARGLVRLIETDGPLLTMGAAARRRAELEFSVERQARQIESVYARLEEAL